MSLLDKSKYTAQIDDIITLSVKKIYRSQEVLEKEIAGYKIISDILDVYTTTLVRTNTPAISRITMEITYDLNNEEMNKEIVMRMFCKSPYGEIGINGQEDVAWEFIDNFFYRLDF